MEASLLFTGPHSKDLSVFEVYFVFPCLLPYNDRKEIIRVPLKVASVFFSSLLTLSLNPICPLVTAFKGSF